MIMYPLVSLDTIDIKLFNSLQFTVNRIQNDTWLRKYKSKQKQYSLFNLIHFGDVGQSSVSSEE